jgi:hypothetical protein
MLPLNSSPHDVGAVILNEDGDRGAAMPPADIPATLSAHLLSLSRAIADAQDEQGLASALSGAMSSCGVDSFHLWRARTEPLLEVIAAWDRGGEPSPRAGERVPRSELRALDAITPDRPLIVSDRAELGG